MYIYVLYIYICIYCMYLVQYIYMFCALIEIAEWEEKNIIITLITFWHYLKLVRYFLRCTQYPGVPGTAQSWTPSRALPPTTRDGATCLTLRSWSCVSGLGRPVRALARGRPCRPAVVAHRGRSSNGRCQPRWRRWGPSWVPCLPAPSTGGRPS